MYAVACQLKHHIKQKDRIAAERSGEEPWFETFLRLANEYDSRVGRMIQDELTDQEQSMTIDEISSVKTRHVCSTPNPRGVGKVEHGIQPALLWRVR